jgi:hypothetical protein
MKLFQIPLEFIEEIAKDFREELKRCNYMDSSDFALLLGRKPDIADVLAMRLASQLNEPLWMDKIRPLLNDYNRLTRRRKVRARRGEAASPHHKKKPCTR